MSLNSWKISAVNYAQPFPENLSPTPCFAFQENNHKILSPLFSGALAFFQWIISHSFSLSIVFSVQVINWLIPKKQASKPLQQVRNKPPNAPVCLLTCCLRACCDKKCFTLAREEVGWQPHEGEHFSPDFFLSWQNITNDCYLLGSFLVKQGKVTPTDH